MEQLTLVEMPVRNEPVFVVPEKSKKKAAAQESENPELLAVLKALRFKLAQQERVPAYIIFSNACLADMAAKAPKTMLEFLNVSGVGEVKATRYGEAFLDAINQFIS